MLARRKARLLCGASLFLLTGGCAAGPAAQAAQRAMAPAAPSAMTPLPPVTPSEISIAPPADAELLRTRYGTPDFVRRDMDSELWRYDSDTCMIFFFLYREGPGLKLRYAETAPRGAQMPTDPLCMQKLNARAGGMF